MRIKFRKNQQRKFIKKVLEAVNSPSLRELANRIGVPYSTLKNYNNESRLLPESLLNDLCYLSKIDKNSLNIENYEKHWGQIKGGKKGRR